MMNNPEEERTSEPHEPHAALRAIVAGHAAFSEGLISAVHQIAGAGGVFLPLSNSGLGGEEIEATFLNAATQHKISVFFTDLPGGSATLAVRRIMRTDSSIVLVTGANLATLLEFAFHADEEPGEAARRAAEKGRASLVAHGGS